MMFNKQFLNLLQKSTFTMEVKKALILQKENEKALSAYEVYKKETKRIRNQFHFVSFLLFFL